MPLFYNTCNVFARFNTDRKIVFLTIPSELDYEASKDLITTRGELNRVLRSLGRFKGSKAYKKVTLPSGEALTEWEKKEIGYQKAVAVRRLNKRMAELKAMHPEYRMR